MSRKKAARRQLWQWLVTLGLALTVVSGAIGGVDYYYQRHFLPRTMIGELDVSNLTREAARSAVEQQYQIDPQQILTLAGDNWQVASTSAQLGLTYQLDKAVANAWHRQQTWAPLTKWWFWLTGRAVKVADWSLFYDEQAMADFLEQVAIRVNQPGRAPSVVVDGGTVYVDAGQAELTLDKAATLEQIMAHFPSESSLTAVMIINSDFQPLTEEQTTLIQTQADRLLGKSIQLTTPHLPDYHRTLSDEEFIPLLMPPGVLRTTWWTQIYDSLVAEVDRPPQEPELVINQTTMRAEKFVPPLAGLVIDESQLANQLASVMATLVDSTDQTMTIELPLVTTPPQKSLAQTNDYGIAEQIGFGESYYAHSSAGRIHNVAVAAASLNGTLVAPGEEFSFNQAIGEVSAATGYQDGYVIKGGRSELAAGGGVCQVSTTLFRALLDSGLQITLRRPHSYRVTYYELDNDPGFDATVYSGNVDLRFINDTDHYVLITASADSTNLYMTVCLYGTSDGRTTQISNYTKTNPIPVPETEYIPDPSLPVGATQQIDWPVAGLTTNFTHTIYNADGSVRSQKDYTSKYQAWSAKYLVGVESN